MWNNTRARFAGVKWEIAWHATQNLLLCLGAIGLFAYITTMHYYLAVPSLFFLALLWYVLYKIEVGYRERRLREGRY